jgi:hypothetical protein
MRKLRRLVAHKRMRDAGVIRVNKGLDKGLDSYFSKHWREYV